VALAVGEHPPANIHDQKWLLVLTGVVIANLKGNSASQWLNANLSFLPEMAGPSNSGPLNWAIGQYAIPRPAGQNYSIGFALDEWAPFVSLSAIYDQAQSIDAGYAVNVWRPNHFATGIDAFTNTPVGNIFTGSMSMAGVALRRVRCRRSASPGAQISGVDLLPEVGGLVSERRFGVRLTPVTYLVKSKTSCVLV